MLGSYAGGEFLPAQFPMSHGEVGGQRLGSGMGRLPVPFLITSRSSCLVWMACKPPPQSYGGSCGFQRN